MRTVLLLILFLPAALAATAQGTPARSAIDSMPPGIDKALAYRNLSSEVVADAHEEGLALAREALRIALKLRNDTLIEQCHFSVALAFDYLNIADSAFHYYDLILESAENRNDDASKAKWMFAKGNAHFYQGNYSEALLHFNEAMKYWESVNNLERMSKVFNNLGIIYRLRNQYDKAVEVYLRSIEIKTRLSDSTGLAASHHNLGKAYYHIGQYEESLKQYDRATFFYKALNDAYEIATVQSMIGTTFIELGKLEEAEQLLLQALPELSKKFSIDFLVLQLNLARIDRIKKNPAAAIERLLPYYGMVAEGNRINSHMSFEEELAGCYAELGNHERAHYHLSQYLRLYKASATESRERLAEEMQARFETREKENTIKLQELEIQKAGRDKQALYLGVAFALLVTVAMVVMVMIKVRSNRKLSVEKAKTESLLRDRETLLREIHHRVKNNLQVVSSLLSIQGREIEDNKAREAVNESRNRVHSMALIHQFLYGEHHLSSIDMPQYVTELSKRLFGTYQIDHQQVKLHVDVDQIMLDVDTAIPLGLIINELITNALKYAYPNEREGNLWLSLKEVQGVLTLQVRDDGVGGGSEEQNASSFGMKLLNAFKQKLEANYTISSSNGFRIDYHVRRYKTATMAA